MRAMTPPTTGPIMKPGDTGTAEESLNGDTAAVSDCVELEVALTSLEVTRITSYGVSAVTSVERGALISATVTV